MTQPATPVSVQKRQENSDKKHSPSAITAMLMYAVALVDMKGLSLIMLPIVTRYLAPETMGQLEIIAVTTSFIGLLLSLSLHEALYRFVPQESYTHQKQSAAQIFWFTVSISTAGALLLTTMIQVTSPNVLGLSKNILSLAAVSLSIEGGLAVGLAWLRMQNRVKAFCTVCIVGSIIQVSLVLCALHLGWGILGILAAGAIAHSLQFVGILYLAGFPLTLPQRKQAQRYFNYCIPMMLSGLCAFGLNGAERYFIVQSSGLTTLGYFAIAAKFALAMCVLVQPFGMWWMPKRFTMLNQNPTNACTYTYLGILLVCALAISVSLVGQWALAFILPTGYAPVSAILTGAIFMVIGKECAELLNLSLLAKKRTAALLLINLVVTITTLVCCVLLSDFGLWAVMIAVGLGQLFRAVVIVSVGHYYRPLPYAYLSMAFTVLITMSSLLVLTLKPTSITATGYCVATLIGLGLLAYKAYSESFIHTPATTAADKSIAGQKVHF